jgi:hypothetical protein
MICSFSPAAQENGGNSRAATLMNRPCSAVPNMLGTIVPVDRPTLDQISVGGEVALTTISVILLRTIFSRVTGHRKMGGPTAGPLARITKKLPGIDNHQGRNGLPRQ